ncbi:MAG: hypothetical protein E7637_00580 [Ruminococcaceae bacterium]|nr:hypothetical protein [Oscillospiraceae bacterium]
MKLSLFDLHCDTPYEMYKQGQQLTKNDLAISLQGAGGFSRYAQVVAFWTPPHLGNEAGWEHLLQTYQNLLRDPAVSRLTVNLSDTYPDAADTRPWLIPSVEDARILDGDLSRLDRLQKMGFRILTPLWAKESCIGGAHDTDCGLTAFGKAVAKKALSLGMLLDVSHASVRAAQELFELSEEYEKPILATHSNAFAVCPVSRNLRDEQIAEVIRSGGLIGINLFARFITTHSTVTTESLLSHVEHFLSLGAEEHLSLGCDMDGCDLFPEIQSLSELPRLAECMLRHGYSEKLIGKLFFDNADRFAKKQFSR